MKGNASRRRLRSGFVPLLGSLLALVRIAAIIRIAALAGIAAPSLAAPPPEAGHGVIQYKNARYPLRLERADGVTYLAFPDIASVFGWESRLDPDAGSYLLRMGSHHATVTPQSPFLTFDDALRKLGASPRVSEGRLYVPADFGAAVMAPALTMRVAWNETGQLLQIEEAHGTLELSTSLVSFGESSKLVLQFNRKPVYRLERGEREVTLVFPGETLSAEKSVWSFQDPYIERLQLDGERLIFRLTGARVAAQPYELADPPRIVFDLAMTLAALHEPGIDPAPGIRGGAFTVVIDPGHGGSETGAKGPQGLLEKDVTLDIARRLKTLLERRGLRAIMTRTGDLALALGDRTAVANNHKADIFVSIHANASPESTARGAETYFLSLEASDEAAHRTATSENASEDGPAGLPGLPAESLVNEDLRLILWDMAQSHELAESSRLAESLQSDLNHLAGTRNRGIKQAPFLVLVGATMPAALVEVAFISNPEEEAQLKSETFKNQIAEAIAAGLARYHASAGEAPAAATAASPPSAGSSNPAPSAKPASP